MKRIMRVGIDLSKNTFVVYGVDERERCVLKRALRRAELLGFFV
jgi:transposase